MALWRPTPLLSFLSVGNSSSTLKKLQTSSNSSPWHRRRRRYHCDGKPFWPGSWQVDRISGESSMTWNLRLPAANVTLFFSPAKERYCTSLSFLIQPNACWTTQPRLLKYCNSLHESTRFLLLGKILMASAAGEKWNQRMLRWNFFLDLVPLYVQKIRKWLIPLLNLIYIYVFSATKATRKWRRATFQCWKTLTKSTSMGLLSSRYYWESFHLEHGTALIFVRRFTGVDIW